MPSLIEWQQERSRARRGSINLSPGVMVCAQPGGVDSKVAMLCYVYLSQFYMESEI